MKPRSIGIVAGGGGPTGSTSVLQDIIVQCQQQYGSRRSYEYPCINFYSYPYSETFLVRHNNASIPSRELSYCVQQLKLVGMEIIVVPCFTMGSYLTYRSYGIELIEMGTIVSQLLEKSKIKNPLVLCSERTRQSRYCDQHFECHYPDESTNQELSLVIEEALKGEEVDLAPLLAKLPDVPILCAMTVLNAQMKEIDDPRWINPFPLLAKHIVNRSYEGVNEPQAGFVDTQRVAAFH